MQRHTFITDDYYAISGEETFDDQNENYSGPAIDKLANYENLEEQHRLVVLPCQIGDSIYYIEDGVIEEDTVMFFTITKNGVKPKLKYHNESFWKHHKWFETVFPTREEAENALNKQKQIILGGI